MHPRKPAEKRPCSSPTSLLGLSDCTRHDGDKSDRTNTTKYLLTSLSVSFPDKTYPNCLSYPVTLLLLGALSPLPMLWLYFKNISCFRNENPPLQGSGCRPKGATYSKVSVSEIRRFVSWKVIRGRFCLEFQLDWGFNLFFWFWSQP